MLKRYALVVFAAVSAGLVLGCGDSESNTESQKTEPQKTEQLGEGKEKAKRPKGSMAKAKPPAPQKAKPAPAPAPAPEPPWLVTLPSGATLDAFLRPEGGNRFFLGRAGRFSGLYELRGGRLVMERPLDRFETGFEWEARGTDEYTLVAQRENIGSNYLGAILKRGKDDQAKKPSGP